MIEKIIRTISPKWALDREKFRLAHSFMEKKRRYEGAGRGRRTDGWIANGSDANAEVYSGLVVLRNRARDLCRNNAYAVNAQVAVVTEVIGDGIVGQVNAPKSKEVDALNLSFKNWSESTKADVEEIFNLYGLQALIMGSIFESGEVLVRRIYPKAGEYNSVPLKIQVLESDFLDSDKNEDKLSNGGRIAQGIEFDKIGRRVAYWLFESHPGSSKVTASKRVPASDIIHAFRRKRPGQVRDVPWLTPVMIPLMDLDGYQDAQLLKQKISACFTAFVRDSEANAYPDATDESTIGDKLEPGALEVLPPGKDIEFATPPSAGDYEQSTRVTLRKISTGLGITYEALTNDYSQSNFSSSRMAGIRFNKNVVSWRGNIFIPQVCNRIWEWFIDAARLEGITKNNYPANWTPPKRDLLNPKEENDADISAIRGGLTTWSKVIRGRGEDPEEVATEMAEDNKRFDTLGIILDSDARKVMKAGILQQPTSAELINENNKT
jgi:lambda family phage portal protein